MNLETIIFEKKGEVARVYLNRPEVLNALNQKLISEMRMAFREIERDEAIKAEVVAAKGRVFCAGADLKALKGMLNSQHEFEKFIRTVHETFNAIEQLSKPVICAVHGLALAGGLELVEACDIVIATEDARLGDQHTNFGFIPGGGGTQRLARIVGWKKAKEIILTGDWLSAAEAARLGLVNKVVPSNKLEDAISEMLEKLTKNKSPLTARRVKNLINTGMQIDLYSALEMEIEGVLHHSDSEDMMEGLKAFEGKRVPAFKGR